MYHARKMCDIKQYLAPSCPLSPNSPAVLDVSQDTSIERMYRVKHKCQMHASSTRCIKMKSKNKNKGAVYVSSHRQSVFAQLFNLVTKFYHRGTHRK